MPGTAETFTITDGDRIDVTVYRWSPPARPAGVLHILHGWAEHAGRYGRLARAVTDAGWVVYADDHRGHGRTGLGQPFGLGDLGPGGQDGVLLAVRDVAERVAADNPSLPRVLLGHSWGSFIAQRYLPIWGAELAGAVLTGTTHRVEGAARTGGFNAAFEPARTPYDWLSRDEAEVDAYIADPWCGFERMQTQAAVVTVSHRTVPDVVGVASSLPILILNGSEDPIGGEAGGQALADHYRSSEVKDVTFISYEGVRHEPFNDTNRDEVTADLLAWLAHRAG